MRARTMEIDRLVRERLCARNNCPLPPGLAVRGSIDQTRGNWIYRSIARDFLTTGCCPSPAGSPRSPRLLVIYFIIIIHTHSGVHYAHTTTLLSVVFLLYYGRIRLLLFIIVVAGTRTSSSNKFTCVSYTRSESGRYAAACRQLPLPKTTGRIPEITGPFVRTDRGKWSNSR